jgi:hypothetical protein
MRDNPKKMTKPARTRTVVRPPCKGRRPSAQPPRTGAYYWLPLPRGKRIHWRLLAFYDQDYGGSAEHQAVWPQILDTLAREWRKPVALLRRRLENSLYGLPRGRVARMTDGTYGIAHGDDSPVRTWESTVRRAFNLEGTPTRCYLDEHERMLPGHPLEVQQALGIKKDLRLKTITWEDEEG